MKKKNLIEMNSLELSEVNGGESLAYWAGYVIGKVSAAFTSPVTAACCR